MKTMQADYTAAHERLRADMAKRETRLIVTMAGLMFGIVGAAAAFLAFLIRMPPVV